MNKIPLTSIPEWVSLNEKLQGLPESVRYYRGALLNDVARSTDQVKKRIDELRDEYEGAYPSSHVSDGAICFQMNHSFASRENLLDFIEFHSLTLPTEVTKSGRIRNEKPVTDMIYTFKHEDLDFCLSYTRDGFPTAHCKIVTNVSYDVACSVDGSDTPE